LTKHTILFLTANSRASERFRLDQEWAGIQRRLEKTRHHGDFHIEARLAASVDKLIRALNDVAPTVVHFSGHGVDHGEISLENERGQPQPLSARALAAIVGTAASNTRLVVLNGCYTDAYAEVLRDKVDCVVGVASSIDYDVARAFATVFYEALGNHRSIGQAVDLGALILAAKELPDESMPRCVTRKGVDKYQAFLHLPSSFHEHERSRSAADPRMVNSGFATHGLRDIEISQVPERIESLQRRDVVAVIGIDRYKSPAWHRLSNAVNDARSAAALFEQLGFAQNTSSLIDGEATATAIRSLVTDELAAKLGTDDSLVLFYAGHGGNRKRRIGRHDVTAGYLIPVDADDRVATWIDLEAWLREVAQLPAKHILVILDACHSGIALDPVVKWRGAGSEEPLGALRARHSRRVITSALADQRAMDTGPYPGHSLFTGCLIEALTHGLWEAGRGVTTGSALGEYLQRRVAAYPQSQQTPDFGTFLLDDRGDLVLSFRRDIAPLVAPRTTTSPAPRRESVRPSWASSSGYDEYGVWVAFEVRGVRQRMRWIPSGTFLMGSPSSERGRWDDERPQHEVTLSRGYWLGETPVTQALWVAVLDENPSRFRGGQAEDAERPMEHVSWDDCQRFLAALNGQVVELAARLPTEAEWERACRAATTTATWIGDVSHSVGAYGLESIAWYGGNSGGQTHPVGRLAPNPYGLHDMLGNVWEWCADEMHQYTAAPVTDPVGNGHRPLRVYRGGSWFGPAAFVRAAVRGANSRDSRAAYLGFRLAAG
jgi:formylglycine-generating enzyme required for sulfatase activity